MAERRDIVNLNVHGELGETLGALFTARMVDQGLRRVHSADWSTSAASLEGIGDLQLVLTGRGRETALLELDGVLVQAMLGGGHVYVSAAGTSVEQLDRTVELLRERLPSPDPSSAHEVRVTFWTYSPHGPQPTWRMIAVPGWEEIGENYAEPTRAGLEALMDGFLPAHGGQLVLWHGKAGTGKTFALRALAWEWRSWCSLHYIVDPDSFFGEHADYLMNVLMMPDELEHPAAFHPHPGLGAVVVDADGDAPKPKPWRLLVLEDTGELLTPDAKTVIGQGLSRFLNLVDGLIGQGLRVLVLVTTNEPIRQLHPAVARPGRCAANVEFVPLTADEAARWLGDRGLDEAPETPEILASLYARIAGRETVEAEQTAGFAGGASAKA